MVKNLDFMKRKQVVCFGEMLWDVFPNQKKVGGAPLNVALHLHRLDLKVDFISRIGQDDLGKELIQILNEYGLPTSLIQIDTLHETSKVLVDTSDKENIKYEICKPVAWDFIEFTDDIVDILPHDKVLVFGSLAARSPKSHESLIKLASQNFALKVLDLNLRAPHYSTALIEQLIQQVQVLKINEEELAVLMQLFRLSGDQQEAILQLAKKFGLKTICLTLGGKGAMLYHEQNLYSHPGYIIDVVDTVGAGDAFLAGLIHGLLEDLKGEELLGFASALGAVVASRAGANPVYHMEDIFIMQKSECRKT